ncbi:MAG: transcriptional regulator [Tunicatimonas sp.]
MKTLNSIQNEADYQEALSAAYELMQDSIKKGSSEEEHLLQLTSLIEAYETEHHAIDEQNNPVEAIKFRMEQMNLKNKDVAPIFGGTTRVSEYLNGKRPLTMKIIYNLHKYLEIPYDLLIEKRESFELEEGVKKELMTSLMIGVIK